MSKNNKKKPATTTTRQNADEDTGSGPLPPDSDVQHTEDKPGEPTAAPHVYSAADLSAAFTVASACEGECTRLDAQLTQARIAKGEALKAIVELTGQSGPFAWKGKKLTIVKRGDFYHFKGESKAKVIEVG